MPHFPPSVPTTNVHIEYLNPMSGGPAKGAVEFVLINPIRDLSGNVIIGSGITVTGRLVNGEATVELPSNVTLRVFVKTDVLVNNFFISVPQSGSTLEFADIIPLNPENIKVGGNVILPTLEIFNVKAFGAIGDGTTDDTDAIESTILAADNAGGGTVYFPVGIYSVTGIVISGVDNISLDGSGAGSVIKIADSNNNNVVRFDQCNKFTITNLTFDGNRDGNVLGVDEDFQCGLHLIYCTDFLIRGIRVYNTHMSGIRLGLFPHVTGTNGACQDGAITNNQIDLGIDADQGIGVWNSTRITVSNNVIRRGGWGGIVLTRSDHCTVSNNVSSENEYTVNGPTDGGHGIALEGAQFCTIDGNTCQDNNVYGIHMQVDPQTSARQVIGCSINGNVCIRNTQGIFAGNSLRNTITGNSIQDNLQVGIEIESDSQEIIISSNMVDNNGTVGIHVKGDSCEITNNIINDNTNEGLLVQTVVGMSAVNNTIRRNGTTGMDLRGVEYSSISGNVILNNEGAGIQLSDEGAVASRFNTISNNNSSDTQTVPTQNRGIEAIGNSDYNIATSNICLNNTDGQITLAGANNVIANNIVAL